MFLMVWISFASSHVNFLLLLLLALDSDLILDFLYRKSFLNSCKKQARELLGRIIISLQVLYHRRQHRKVQKIMLASRGIRTLYPICQVA